MKEKEENSFLGDDLDFEEIKRKYGVEGWKEVPSELINSATATKSTIEFLKLLLKVQQGRYVEDLKGIKNKIRHYLLGYPLLTDK